MFLKVSTNIGPFKWQIIELAFSKMKDTYCTGLSFAQQFPNGILNFGSLWQNRSGCIWYNGKNKRKKIEGGMYFERGMGYKWVHTSPSLWGTVEKKSRPETIFKLAAYQGLLSKVGQSHNPGESAIT